MLKRGKVAIIGASYLQEPLIDCAKDNGYETHVFAWKVGCDGEKKADYFYPISIVEKETILEKCKEIGIDAICSIASDLATVTVNYIAEHLGLNGNSISCTKKTTNKSDMRHALENNMIPCPRYNIVDSDSELDKLNIEYPAIVKPTDRSGSRGVYKLDDNSRLKYSVRRAIDQSLEKRAIIESYIRGIGEYSIEYITYHGKHHFVSSTKKYTTGAPLFIERGQMQPSGLKDDILGRAKLLVERALDALEITDGASHSEIIIGLDETIWIVEIGARMGGDLIGSHLVKESTGIDMVRAVLQVALDVEPDLTPNGRKNATAIRYIMDNADLEVYKMIQKECPEIVLQSVIPDEIIEGDVSDSSKRPGYYLLSSDSYDKIIRFMPEG